MRWAANGRQADSPATGRPRRNKTRRQGDKEIRNFLLLVSPSSCPTSYSPLPIPSFHGKYVPTSARVPNCAVFSASLQFARHYFEYSDPVHNRSKMLGITTNRNTPSRRARKSRTFFFNALDADGFDQVVNPVVIEPVVQFTLYLKVKYEMEQTKTK